MDALTIKNELRDLSNMIKLRLIAELERQGHVATGKLLKSIEVAPEQTTYNITIYGRYAYYGSYVDAGRNARVKRVPIDALIAWIRVKKLDLGGRREIDVAFAIQTAIFKNGIPTDRNMGKRRFMSSVLENSEQDILAAIDRTFGKMVEKEIFNIVEATQTSYNSMRNHA